MMIRSLIAGFLILCGFAFGDTPSISNISISPDTNAVTVKYDTRPQASHAITAAVSSGQSTTYTIGGHTVMVNDWVVITGVSPAGFNTSSSGPGFLVTAVTSTTVTVAQAVSATYTGGGTLTVWPYCWVQYGVTNGQFLWSSSSYNTAQFNSSFSLTCSVPISGLADGTTYYFLPTARPHADDEKDSCNNDSCGAASKPMMTAAASISHLPAAPASVSANLLSEPDTTSYSIVNLTPSGPNNECASTAIVNPPSGYKPGASWNGHPVTPIAANDTLSTILNPANGKIWYGTVFQVPGGTTCIVPHDGTPWGRGYRLPVLPADPSATSGAINAANHRFIMFRTTPTGNAADFPPFNTRTSPAFFNGYGGFQQNTPVVNPAYIDGSIFDMNADYLQPDDVHHYWIENLKFTVDETQTTKNFDYFITFGLEGGLTPPFPRYISIRGNYFHGPARANLQTGTPSVAGVIAGNIDSNIAIVGNYSDNIYYAAGSSPGGQGIVQGIMFGQGTGGPVLIHNNYVMGMPMSIYVEQTNFSTATAHDFTVTRNALYWPLSTLAYSKVIGSYGCRNQIEFKGVARAVAQGNYVNGQWACANTGAALMFVGWNQDVRIVSNIVRNGVTLFALGGVVPHQWGGVAGTGNRYLISNNLAYDLNRVKNQAGGGGFGASVLEIEAAVNNVTFVNNTIGPITAGTWWAPWILLAGGSGTGPMAGLTVSRNILPMGFGNSENAGGIIIGQDTISGPGVSSHPSTPIGNYNMTLINHAMRLASVAGYAAATDNLGMQGVSVIAPGSGYAASGGLRFTNCKNSPEGVFNAVSGAITGAYGVGLAGALTSFGSGCNPATMTVSPIGGGSGALLRPHYGLTPAYAWQGNVNICTYFNGVEMGPGQCLPKGGLSVISTMPANDSYPPGPTLAKRLAAAGLPNAGAADYRCTTTAYNSCAAGANINQLESDQGIVSRIETKVAATSASISYLAPDSRACSVDISPEGKVWTRNTYSGTDRQQTIIFNELSPATTYQYRVICYFDQSEGRGAGWFSFPSDPSNLATSGTLTTLAPSVANVSFPFAVAQFTGSTSTSVTMTAVDGTQQTHTCTASPCTVGNVPAGDYSAVQQWLAGSAVMGFSDKEIVKVR